ncbi:MAG: hypothetical protein E2O39_14555 [Planctomycetota bacterium]|nr:MAG: hypothetical protein E2O39_14555 [Planctomycetota bacterium]
MKTQSAALATFVALSTVLFVGGAEGRRSPQSASASIAQQANEALGLSRSEVGDLHLLETLGERIIVEVDLLGAPLYLDLAPHSVRAEGFEVREQLEDGSWNVVEPAPVSTYRGTVLGEPESVVAASLLEDGLHARIRLAAGREFWIEPLAPHVPGAGAAQHVVYETDAVVDPGKTCDADVLGFTSLGNGPGLPAVPGQRVGGGGGNPELVGTTAKLGCDADYEYFQDWGAGTQSRIESVVNAVNLQYESDVDITHMITTILIRTSSDDPYSKKPADQLLFEFRAEWNTNQVGIQRDLAQLFTGRNLAGGTIGIAWVGVVCNLDLAYSLVESDYNNNFSCATDLSAHEMGHSWGAGHCSCSNFTMNAFITCANDFNPTGTIPTIIAYRDSQSCFGPVDPPGDPVSIHVDSIVLGTQNAGQGNKFGTASVTIVTDTGTPEAGATVMGTFSGDYNDTVVGRTDASGTATFITSTTQKGHIVFMFCVDNVTESALPYLPAENVETCDNF